MMVTHDPAYVARTIPANFRSPFDGCAAGKLVAGPYILANAPHIGKAVPVQASHWHHDEPDMA